MQVVQLFWCMHRPVSVSPGTSMKVQNDLKRLTSPMLSAPDPLMQLWGHVMVVSRGRGVEGRQLGQGLPRGVRGIRWVRGCQGVSGA